MLLIAGTLCKKLESFTSSAPCCNNLTKAAGAPPKTHLLRRAPSKSVLPKCSVIIYINYCYLHICMSSYPLAILYCYLCFCPHPTSFLTVCLFSLRTYASVLPPLRRYLCAPGYCLSTNVFPWYWRFDSLGTLGTWEVIDDFSEQCEYARSRLRNGSCILTCPPVCS